MDKKLLWSIAGNILLVVLLACIFLMVANIQIKAYDKFAEGCDNKFGKDNWYMEQRDCSAYRFGCGYKCFEIRCYENYVKVSCSQFKQDYDDWEHYCNEDMNGTICSVQGTISSEEWATLERAKNNSERALANTEQALNLTLENNRILEEVKE